MVLTLKEAKYFDMWVKIFKILRAGMILPGMLLWSKMTVEEVT